MAAKPPHDKNIEKSQKSLKSQRSQSPTSLLGLPAAAPQAATCEIDAPYPEGCPAVATYEDMACKEKRNQNTQNCIIP